MKRRKRVELSDHAQALASLRGLHKIATDASLPRASCTNASVASPVGSSTFVASLLDKPSVDDPLDRGLGP